MIQRKIKIPLIKDVMNPLDGPFKRMNYDFEFIEKEQLDLLFSLSFGERPVAPLIEFYIDTNGDNFSLSELSKETISNLETYNVKIFLTSSSIFIYIIYLSTNNIFIIYMTIK